MSFVINDPEIDKRHEIGSFDIIGDVHGCYDELIALLKKLGYMVDISKNKISHPNNRRLIFVGDLVDRGPKSPEVLRLVMNAISGKIAFCVCGNHDDKLKRKLKGNNVQLKHGLLETIQQLENEPDVFKSDVIAFIDSLAPYYLFDQGKLVVVHAGIREDFFGKLSPKIRAYCLYGPTTGEFDSTGLPIRYPWANDYHGDPLIVYGHSVVDEPLWVNNTINIDTGCVFGGKLTALRYPELEIISIQAKQMYYVYHNSI
jgi:protein phosphatase